MCHLRSGMRYPHPTHPNRVPSCSLERGRYDQAQMRKLMMKSHEGTEALERRRKQVDVDVLVGCWFGDVERVLLLSGSLIWWF